MRSLGALVKIQHAARQEKERRLVLRTVGETIITGGMLRG
jgi:hypothetical protein